MIKVLQSLNCVYIHPLKTLKTTQRNSHHHALTQGERNQDGGRLGDLAWVKVKVIENGPQTPQNMLSSRNQDVFYLFPLQKCFC